MIKWSEFTDSFMLLNQYYLFDEHELLESLRSQANLNKPERDIISKKAEALIEKCRDLAGTGTLFDAFLQEYGLSSEEGVTLMRLAEALIRTPDELTAQQLIRDKFLGRNWSAHSGQSESTLVNLSTQGMSLSSHWIAKTGGKIASNLLARIGDAALHKGVTVAMGVMSGHFVLGRDIISALRTAKPYEADGFAFSYDMLGEAAHTQKDAERYFQNYKHAILAIAKNAQTHDRIETAPGISVKLSALHPRYEFAKADDCIPALIARMKEMCLIAKEANISLNIDAEEADRLEMSLVIAKALIEDEDLMGWDGFGMVVQAYQRRAVPALETLIDWARAADRRICIRLVKGAYWDMEIKRAQEMGLESYPVFTRKENTDVSYLACSRLLLEARDIVFPQFATHNAATMSAILHMSGNDRSFEFQRLHGMGDVLHREVMKKTGVKSRIYAPVGAYRDLLPYLVRRLLENGANSSFVNQFLDPDVPAFEIADDPISETEGHERAENPKIKPPRDLFDGERLSAKGLDLTQYKTAVRINALAGSWQSITAMSIINGKSVKGKAVEIINPANSDEVIGSSQSAQPKNLEQAIQACKSSGWSIFSAKQRAGCLLKVADLLEIEMDRFMQICVKEAGKTWLDAVAEVREAVDFCRYYANQAQSPRIIERQPLGIVACISPWNFPLAIFLGQVTASLVVGNTVICKPAEQTPLIAFEVVKLLHKAGVPKDALHLILGEGVVIGAALVEHQGVNGICFTGSTQTAKYISKSLSQTDRPLTPFIAETGGINAMIIDSTALLEQAVSDVVASAFQSAGQRCSACRLVCIQDDIADDFLTMLIGAMDLLMVSDPIALSTDIGPVIDSGARSMLIDYVQTTQNILNMTAIEESEKGHFVPPTVIGLNKISELTDEKFGPILHVLKFKADEISKIVDDVNALGYGLTMGLHTRIDARIEAVSAQAKVGNLYVNRNQIGAVVGVQPFGGEGLSGTGPKAGGPAYLLRLSKGSLDVPRVAQNQLDPAGHQDMSDIVEKAKQALEGHQIDRVRGLVEHLPLQVKNGLETALKSFSSLLVPHNLPGPTGEDNRLSHIPRGTLLCLADNSTVLKQQICLALASGHAVIAVDHDGDLISWKFALMSAGLSENLIQFVSHKAVQSLVRGAINGVIVDGQYRDYIGHLLCLREGALLPILSIHAEPERFFLERTCSIDTTAAGGNASLLAMTSDE